MGYSEGKDHLIIQGKKKKVNLQPPSQEEQAEITHTCQRLNLGEVGERFGQP